MSIRHPRSGTFWAEFWRRLLSPATARFVLALLALFFAGAGFLLIMLEEIGGEREKIVTFALGQLFALPFMAFGYYFGSTARSDDRNRGEN